MATAQRCCLSPNVKTAEKPKDYVYRPPQFHAGMGVQPCILPAPGKPGHYPHADEIAARPCAYCGQPIGHERRFWFVQAASEEVMHASCHAAGAKRRAHSWTETSHATVHGPG